MCVCVCLRQRYIFWHHTQSKDLFTLWICKSLPATITQTDRCTEPVTESHELWTLFLSHLTPVMLNTWQGFVGALDGWVGAYHVSACVLVCQCVGVCQFVSSGAYRTWTRGATVSFGWMNCSRLHCCKIAAVFVSTPLCSSRNTDSDKWLLSHCRDCMGGQRDVRSGKPTQWNINVCS